MSIAKVIEIISESDKSWDDAAQKAVDEASKTVQGIKSIWVDNFSAVVENGRVSKYRLNGKVTFLVDR